VSAAEHWSRDESERAAAATVAVALVVVEPARARRRPFKPTEEDIDELDWESESDMRTVRFHSSTETAVNLRQRTVELELEEEEIRLGCCGSSIEDILNPWVTPTNLKMTLWPTLFLLLKIVVIGYA
jgi:hypothetical protein